MDLNTDDIKKELEKIKKKASDDNEKEEIYVKDIDLEETNEDLKDEDEDKDTKNENEEKKDIKEKNNIDDKKDKKVKNKKGNDSEKVPASTIDKVLNIIIILILLCFLAIGIYFGYQITKTKHSSVPKIEESLKKFQEKENYTYIVSIENTNKNCSESYKISKIEDFTQIQIQENEDSYAIIKKENHDPIYLVKDSKLNTLKDITTEEYKKYNNMFKMDYLNIKKYSLGSLIAMKDNNNNIVLSKGKVKLQFDSKTYMPSVFIDGDKKISYEFLDEEPKLIIPYLKNQIKDEEKQKENK